MNVKERLNRLSVPVPEAGCWLWTGGLCGPMGYGSFTVRTGVSRAAHRVSWEVHRGEIPAGMFVCHRCDTPSCINPDHLFLGTHADNMADCVAKGRHAIGSDAGGAKLTEAQVELIRQSSEPGPKLATEYGVSNSTISCIRTGKLWAHVVTEPRKERLWRGKPPFSGSEKTCTRCAKLKPVAEFPSRPPRGNGRRGLFSICKDCKRERARESRRKQSARATT